MILIYWFLLPLAIIGVLSAIWSAYHNHQRRLMAEEKWRRFMEEHPGGDAGSEREVR